MCDLTSTWAVEKPYHLRRQRLMAGLLKAGITLDIGCAARNLRGLLPSHEYFGLDIRGGDVLASAEALPFRDECFDSVGCGEVIEHLAHPGLCIDEIHRVVKSGGVAAVTTPNLGTLFHAKSFLDDPEHVSCMNYSQLLKLVKAFGSVRRHGFDIFLEPPLHGLLRMIPYRFRRALAQRFLALDKILVLELRK